jgi:hypothetical protein
VKKFCIVVVMSLGCVLASDVAAQVPEEVAKSSAELAARQAEAIERARLKVAQEAERERERKEKEEIARRDAVVPVDVEVVISRYQGDKKVSSLPYALTVNAARHDVRVQHKTILKMGGEVPMPIMAPQLGPDGQPKGGGGLVQYRNIGTQIDCAARPLDDGRFELFISVEDTAIAPQAGDTQPGMPPALRKFASSNTIVLRDGQTRQFTAAADRITGEVVRVDVTLRVAK